MRFFVYLALIASLAGCQWESKKPSFLVITIDSLPFDAIHCNETEKYKGFKTVCEEMIRFTHAYTPSILSQSAIASFLTGKYPFEHGVWNNGSSYLSARFKTSSEVAYEQGYKTSFISGGPPIWRKSGLEQGFETFDDNIFVDYGRYYRPAFDNLKVEQEWLNNLSSREVFFSFVYLPDLQFPEVPTVDNEGYARETTYEGQLAEIDESLEGFFNFLKKEKKWNNTWIIVAGLNGISREARSKEFQATNLYHENTNVALFIKPPQKEHQNFSWTVDFNTSLVDVGRTLFDLLDSEFYDTTTTLFQTISLKKALLNAENIPQDRVLLFESGWPQWRRLGRTLFALQKDNYFMLYENPPKLFNTLIDRNQVYPIDIHQDSMQVLTQTANQLIGLLNVEDSPKLDKDVIAKYALGRSFFRKNKLNEDVVRDLQVLHSKTKDEEIAGWLARFYIQNARWKDLLALGSSTQQMDWIWLASKNLDLPPPQPSNCLKLLSGGSESTFNYYNVCNDTMLVQFLSWVKSKNKNTPEAIASRDSFFKSYRLFRTDLDIQKFNMQNGYVWDTATDKIYKPQNIELVLALNEMARYKLMIDKRF